MKEITLDGKKLQRTEEGHNYLSEIFDFPEYYGKNLDALYDLLTGVSEPVKINIDYSEAMDEKMKLVFKDAVLDNDCLCIKGLGL